MVASPLPADIATALKYGVQTQQAVRRSSYLADALKALQAQGSQPIQSYGELGAKLIAQAILQRKYDKAQGATMSALKADQDTETQSILGGFRPPTPPAAPTAPEIASQPQPSPQAPPPVVAQPAAPPPAPPVDQVDPRALDALTRMGFSEAGGEGPDGMAAAMHVALNRLRTGYGGARTLMDVVHAPHQFEGMTSPRAQISPDDPNYQKAREVALRVMTGQAPDPTGGAINFLNPNLQAQLGRQQPAWAPQGQGQRIGNHVFYGGHPGSVPQQQPMAPQQQMAGGLGADTIPPQGQDVQPFQVAANGPLQPGMTPSGPPQGAPGAAPAAAGPQAAAAGAQQAWPNWRPTDGELAWLQHGLADPRTHEAFLSKAQEWSLKAQQPAESQIVQINGVPFYVSKTPGEGGQPVAIPVPDGAKSHIQTAEQLKVPAPPGSTFNVDPFGNAKPLTTPQNGQQVTSAPGQPYREAPVQGGTQDPRSPANAVSNELQLRKEYDPSLKAYVAARDGYEKVLSAARDSTGASDIALIFGFMKTLDPTSTVREGEFATAQNSGSVDQTIMNLYNKAIHGERLQPEQRDQFAKTAASQFGVAEQRFKQINDRFSGLASSYGFDPNHVIQTFPTPSASQTGAPPAPDPNVIDRSGKPPGWSGRLPPAQLQAAMKFKGTKESAGTPGNPYIVHTPEDAMKHAPGSSILLPDGRLGKVPPR